MENAPFLKHSNMQIFHNQTKNQKRPLSEGISRSKWPKEWSQIFYKTYPRFKKYDLPLRTNSLEKSLERVLLERKSVRRFDNRPISKESLSDLLHYSFGEKERSAGQRHYPSAGARYPIEVYSFIMNVKGMSRGLYHYRPKDHKLEYLWDVSEKKINEMFTHDVSIKKEKPAVLLILTAVFWRTEMKYKERGYRYILLDCGHMCQNAYLVSGSLGIGCCSIGGFFDDKVNEVLDIDGIEESPVIILQIGKERREVNKK